MTKYLIFAPYPQKAEMYRKEFENNQQVIEWIENHLDLSKNWQFKIIK